MKNKLFAVLLSLTMLLGMVPAVALATEIGTMAEILLTMEGAYATQTIGQNWENVAFVDVAFADDNKDNAAYESIQSIKVGTSASDIMKAIFTLELLGYDPAQITYEDGTTGNAFALLNDLAVASNFYLAPYVLLALGEHGSDAQIQAHIQYLCEEVVKDSNYTWGVDASAVAIAALAPYYEEENVAEAVDGALSILESKVSGGTPEMNTNTNAMVILAYAMLGQDPALAVYSDGVTVVDDLLSATLADGSGFGWGGNATINASATRQGMLALKALVAYEQSGQGVNPFDFSDATLLAIDEGDVNPENAGEESDPSMESVIVMFSYASDSALVILPHEVEVTGNLSEAYGITTNETISAPTVLDAIIAAHVETYGDGFTQDTAETYVNATLSKLFGEDGFGGHFINGGYSADYASAAVIADGDLVDTFLYAPDWSNQYVAFAQDGTIVRDLALVTGQEVALTLQGDMTSVEGLAVGTLSDGVFTKLSQTDADSAVTLLFEEAGTYLLVSDGTATVSGTNWYGEPEVKQQCAIVPAWCYVTVAEDTTPTDDITVTVNISNNGAFVTGINDTQMAGIAITLDGSETATHDIDGALYQAHGLYYDGEDGYASSVGWYGLSLDKLWGDTSWNWGYQVNGGTVTTSDLSQSLSDDDVVDAYIMAGDYMAGTLEAYTRFDTSSSTKVGKSTTVTLEQAGYDSSWQIVFAPCVGATIYIDGVATTAVTDENGQASISFDTVGTHWLTAKKDANEDGITDIVAPYGTVTVTASSSSGGSSGGGSGGSSSDSSDFEVRFAVIDDEERTWFTETVTLEEGDTVKDAFDAAFAAHSDYDYQVDGGTYVASITHPEYGTYGEFTNGSNSGWKYKVNDVAPESTGYSDYEVAADDEIVFYFVVDYTQDTTSSSSSSSSKSDAEEVADVTHGFTDMDESIWCYDAVNYVVEAGLFQGASDTTFAPDGTMTRAMIWMVLARHAGVDTETDDVWYLLGQQWAMETGLSDGTNPDDAISRQQLVTMLYRYAIAQGQDVSVGENSNMLAYTDVADVAEYAIAAMEWACGAGILNGNTASTLNPTGTANRGQVATILMRYLEC